MGQDWVTDDADVFTWNFFIPTKMPKKNKRWENVQNSNFDVEIVEEEIFFKNK